MTSLPAEESDHRLSCRDIMGCAVGSVPPDTTVDAVARTMAEQRVGLIAVCDSAGTLLGVITDRDIALRICARNQRASEVPVSAVMTKDVVTCHERDPAAHAEELMLAHQKFRVVVVDDAGHFVGVISLTDVLHFEAPLRAAAVGRSVTSRQFRMRPRSSPPSPGGST